ncbi:MAG: ABC transporter ATP-binding protein [Armatimonadetes bacterium]|nr:ABC transporter ATP-binding protein [Armatimonadota bacterium]
MPAAISVSDLHVRYRAKNGASVHAVQGLSFEVQPGEIVGFLGPNGAGKSSTIKALMGFVAPESGTCSIHGEPAGSLAAKGRVGYLPEVAMYYPFLTPLETLCLYGRLQGLKGNPLKSEAERLLTSLGLGGALKKHNRTLSKGMLQRVGIAQALLGSPDVLILDEVTSGLDPIGRKELREVLLEKQRQGCTLFFSSHELAEVESLCARILVIHQGQLIEERQIGDLREELQAFRIAYLGTCDLSGLCAEPSRSPDGPWEASFATKDAFLQGLQRLAASGATIVDVEASEGSLEDYFIDTIRRAA